MTQAELDNETELWRQLRKTLFDLAAIEIDEWEAAQLTKQTPGARLMRVIEAWAAAAAKLQKELRP